MDTKSYDLTPEQKGLLESLSRQTGKDIPSLIAEALGKLKADVRPNDDRDSNDADGKQADAQLEEERKPIWEQIRENFSNVPEEELESLPVDGAAQVDHYAYGLPKR